MQDENYFLPSGIHSDVSPEIDHGRVLTILGIVAVLVLAMGMAYLFFVCIQILDRIATAQTLAEQERRE